MAWYLQLLEGFLYLHPLKYNVLHNRSFSKSILNLINTL